MARSTWFACAVGLLAIGLAMPSGAQREQPTPQRQEQQRPPPQAEQARPEAQPEEQEVPLQHHQQEQLEQRMSQSMTPAGAREETLNGARQIGNTLGGIVYQHVTDDEFPGRRDVIDFEGMVDYLARPDRNRIGTVDAERLRRLTTIIEALRTR